jgi:hypothetical protein
VAPLACAAANFIAALVLVLVLAPGTPLVADVVERQRYIREHLLEWRAGWAVWMLAAATLLWCYVWWRARVKGPRSAIVIAAIGITADWSAEFMLILGGADRYADVAPLAFFLTGAIANGLYTVAGIQLTVAMPLTPRARMYAAFMWSAGLMLSLGAVIMQPLITAIASALLFGLFCPWCVWLWWRFRAGEAHGP